MLKADNNKRKRNDDWGYPRIFKQLTTEVKKWLKDNDEHNPRFNKLLDSQFPRLEQEDDEQYRVRRAHHVDPTRHSSQIDNHEAFAVRINGKWRAIYTWRTAQVGTFW